MTAGSIDAYLDDMFERVEGTPAERRRLLSEIEEHLRDSAASFESQGYDEPAAERAAVSAFGESDVVARLSNRRDPKSLILAVIRAVALLAVSGFAAIGLGALLSKALAVVTSTQWVYGGIPGFPYTSEQCAHWLSLHPTAPDCATAAVLESADDNFILVLGASIAGLLLAGLVLIVLRMVRRGAPRSRLALPAPVVRAAGAAAFLCAGVALLAFGIAGQVRGPWGQGMMLTDAAVALAFGLAFAILFLGSVRPVRPRTA